MHKKTICLVKKSYIHNTAESLVPYCSLVLDTIFQTLHQPNSLLVMMTKGFHM